MIKSKADQYIEKYMKEEYSSLNSENKFVGKFILKNTKGKVLDFGCGPNLLFWSIFMKDATRIDAFDILPENIGYVKKTLDMKSKPPIYHEVAKYVQKTSKNNDANMLNNTVERIKVLKIADMFKPLPFTKNFYDTVTEIGCIGCVSTYEELLTAVRNIYKCLRNGGKAIIVNWIDRQNTNKEEITYFDGTVEISKAIFKKVFTQAGFRKIDINYKKNNMKTSLFEYKTIIYGTAIK